MTANQINYQGMLENRRHNQVSEGIQMGSLEEDIRSHKKNEAINLINAKTNQRNAHANLKNAHSNAINAGTNKFNAKVGYKKYKEDVRTHKANEAIGVQQANAALKQANAADIKANVALQDLVKYAGKRVDVERTKASASKQQAQTSAKQSNSAIFANMMKGKEAWANVGLKNQQSKESASRTQNTKVDTRLKRTKIKSEKVNQRATAFKAGSEFASNIFKAGTSAAGLFVG